MTATLWDLQKGSTVRHNGRIMVVLEEPHPLLIDSGIECQLRSVTGGKPEFFRDYKGVKERLAFEVLRGPQDFTKEELSKILREKVEEAIIPIFSPLIVAGRVEKGFLKSQGDTMDIFIGEILSAIP